MAYTTPLRTVPSPPEQSAIVGDDRHPTFEFFDFMKRVQATLTSHAAALTQVEPPKALESKTVATLSAAASSTGKRFLVTDSNSTTFNATVAGGGANIVPVFSNGTNWKIG